MAYRKLGRTNKHRRSMLATLTKQLIMNESITTTETRAKELRKSFDKMPQALSCGNIVHIQCVESVTLECKCRQNEFH